jgi:hypothetical protein
MLSRAQRAKLASSPKRMIITAAALIAVILALAAGQQKIQLEAALGKAGPHVLGGRQADVEG